MLIYRLPIAMSFKKGRSICVSCRHELHSKDLFPLFSWLFLLGKCRYCKAKISARYPLVEALNGTLYVLIYIFIAGGNGLSGFSIALLGWFAAVSALIVLSFVDLEHQIIPDSMWITIFIGGILVFIDEIINDGFEWQKLLNRVIGIFAVGGLFFLIGVISGGRAMGGGDVKLMAAAGFLLGWKLIILSLFLGAFAGVLYSLLSKLINKTKMRGAVPFGPFLSIGIVLSMFVGDSLIEAYLSIL